MASNVSYIHNLRTTVLSDDCRTPICCVSLRGNDKSSAIPGWLGEYERGLKQQGVRRRDGDLGADCLERRSGNQLRGGDCGHRKSGRAAARPKHLTMLNNAVDVPIVRQPEAHIWSPQRLRLPTIYARPTSDNQTTTSCFLESGVLIRTGEWCKTSLQGEPCLSKQGAIGRTAAPRQIIIKRPNVLHRGHARSAEVAI
eukprot:6206644-Pleurochrysis_carterae.AAC.2